MKQQMIKLAVGLIAMMVIACFLLWEYKGNAAYLTPFSFLAEEETIQTWEEEGTYYLFLPAFVKPEEAVLTKYSSSFEIPELGIRVGQGDSLGQLLAGQVYFCRREDTGEEFRFCLMQSEELAAVFVTTASAGRESMEKFSTDKEYRERGMLRTVNEEGKRENTISLRGIGARGNVSYHNYDKTPLTLLLEKEASLLGLPKGDKYALMANAADPLLLRNDLCRRLEEALGVKYAHQGRFVDLYVNEVYQGNYYLVDTLRVGAERIAITDLEGMSDLVYEDSDYEAMPLYETETAKARQFPVLPDDITGGYLLEREFEERYRYEYEEIGSGFQTAGGECFVLKSPKYVSKEQIQYLEKWMNEVEEAIYAADGIHSGTGKSYREYIDLDSFVKRYLTEEISKNYDGGVSSVYFYKDTKAKDDKLYFGPGWDYDMSWGNGLDWMEYYVGNAEGISRLNMHENCSQWYTALYDKEDFLAQVQKEYWEGARPFLMELTETMAEEYEAMLGASFQMNYIRWQSELENNFANVDFTVNMQELTQFILERIAYLDSVWG